MGETLHSRCSHFIIFMVINQVPSLIHNSDFEWHVKLDIRTKPFSVTKISFANQNKNPLGVFITNVH